MNILAELCFKQKSIGITAKLRGTYLLLEKERFFFVSKSDIVQTNANILKYLCKDLLSKFQPTEQLSWFNKPLISWLLPFIRLLIILFSFDAWCLLYLVSSVTDYHAC